MAMTAGTYGHLLPESGERRGEEMEAGALALAR
jgi:hypothetical protein